MSLRRVIAGCIAGSLTFSSTAALAAPAAAPQVNPWAVLTAMSGGAPAAAMCGSASTTAAGTTAAATATTAAMAQGPNGCVLPVMDTPLAPPVANGAPPPLPPAAGISPLLLGLVAIAAAAGIYLAFNAGNHANSPA